MVASSWPIPICYAEWWWSAFAVAPVKGPRSIPSVERLEQCATTAVNEYYNEADLLHMTLSRSVGHHPCSWSQDYAVRGRPCRTFKASTCQSRATYRDNLAGCSSTSWFTRWIRYQPPTNWILLGRWDFVWRYLNLPCSQPLPLIWRKDYEVHDPRHGLQNDEHVSIQTCRWAAGVCCSDGELERQFPSCWTGIGTRQPYCWRVYARPNVDSLTLLLFVTLCQNT